MGSRKFVAFAFVVSLWGAQPTDVRAQAAAAAAAPTPTIWRFLGLPQGAAKLRNGLVNRRGNFPGLEKKPPLLKLADPANLESKNPAIKKAAEIKAEEDLAKQKIKALKYLAKVGCGCYPGVKEALMAALDDCTEKVRVAAANAIRDGASKQCETCNKACCCDEELSKKLADIAYERDDEGCYKERSEDVRNAALEALRACCRGGRGDMPVEAETTTPEVIPQTPQGEVIPQTPRSGEAVPPTDQPPAPPKQTNLQPKMRGLAVNAHEFASSMLSTKQHTSHRPVHRGSQHKPAQSVVEPERLFGTAISDRHEKLPAEPPVPGEAEEATEIISSPTAPIFPSPPAPANSEIRSSRRARQAQSASTTTRPLEDSPAAKVAGQVAGVDAKNGTLTLTLPKRWVPVVGTRVKVFQQYLFAMECLGEVEITSSAGGTAKAKPIGSLDLKRVARGDQVSFNSADVSLAVEDEPAQQIIRVTDARGK